MLLFFGFGSKKYALIDDIRKRHNHWLLNSSVHRLKLNAGDIPVLPPVRLHLNKGHDDRVTFRFHIISIASSF